MSESLERLREMQRRRLIPRVPKPPSGVVEQARRAAEGSTQIIITPSAPSPPVEHARRAATGTAQATTRPLPVGTKTMTQKMFAQETYEKERELGKDVSSLQIARAGIDPSKTYRWTDRFGQTQHGTGAVLISQYYDPAIKTAQRYYVSSQKSRRKAYDLPPSAKIRTTETGYEIHRDPFAESRAEWKTLSPGQQFGKSLWVGATQWPGLLFGGFLDVKKHQKNIMGWEAGTWERAKEKDYGAIAVEALTSPAMTEVYITLGTMGLFRAAPHIARGAIKTGARTYRTISSVIPEERLIPKIFSKGLYSSPIAKDIYRWGAKGYRFTKYPIGETVKTPFRISKTIGKDAMEIVSKQIKTSSKTIRSLLSPEKYALAQKQLTSRLGTRIDIGFPRADIRAGVGSIDMNIYAAQTRLVQGRLVTGTFSRTVSRQIGKEMPIIFSASKYGAPGFTRGVGKRGIYELFGGKGTTMLKPYLPRQPLFYGKLLESGDVIPEKVIGHTYGAQRQLAKVIPSTHPGRSMWYNLQHLDIWGGTPTQLFGKAAQKAGEKWTLSYQLRHPLKHLASSTRAVQSLMPSIQPHVTKSVTGNVRSLSGKLGLIKSLQAPRLPVTGGGLVTPTLYATAHMFDYVKPVDYQSRFKLSTMESRRDMLLGLGFFSGVKPIAASSVFSDLRSNLGSLSALDVGTRSALGFKQVQKVTSLYAAPIPTLLRQPRSYRPVAPSGLGAPLMFPRDISGRGRKQYMDSLWKEFYKLRVAATYNPLKEMMGISLSPKKSRKRRKR